MDYKEFIESKKNNIQDCGFDIIENQLNEKLFDFQKYIVKKALKKGRYAIFADCGLGKTLMQLEWASQIYKKEKIRTIILCPLAVAGQTIQEGKKFNIELQKYDGSEFPIQIINYEQIDNIDISLFDAVILDESSILKNYEGKLKNKIIEIFKNYKYKLACTATPSPNDPMELGNHCEFLNVMNRNEMLSMYFIHDGGNTSKWRIKKHARDVFYRFVGSWSIMLNNPQDIGFPMCGYDLPELNLIEKKIISENIPENQLFTNTAVSAIDFNAELRKSMQQRLDKVIDIVNNSKENFIIWIRHNKEGEYLTKNIADCREVKGNDTNDYKENTLLGFANNEFRVLVTKQKIASFGMNFQNCSNQIFASLDFSFEGLYQSIRRSYRFGQKNNVNIYLITVDTMENVKNIIDVKQKQFKEMQNEMSKYINAELINNSDSLNIDNIKNEYCQLIKGDCVSEIKNIADNSVGLSVFSPPFADLYTYSNNIEDMGNSKDMNEFVQHFKYLVKELYRVMMSGRNVCVHSADLPILKGKEGFIGLRDFTNIIRECFENEGFIYHSRITIWKDPVVEMQRTKALGLLHKQIKKDSTMSRVGLPDYIMVFRKDGERLNKVTNTDLSVDLWQKYASPVWFDIDYSNTLNYRIAKDSKDEKHICPLQLGTIERLIHLYSNKGDVVFTPFMGIGSEVYQSIKMGRYGIGIELKDSYYKIAKQNINNIILSKQQNNIF